MTKERYYDLTLEYGLSMPWHVTTERACMEAIDDVHSAGAHSRTRAIALDIISPIRELVRYEQTEEGEQENARLHAELGMKQEAF